jgi:hypothetical protein
MFLLRLGINEFLCGNRSHNESSVRLFRRGKEFGQQPLAEVRKSQIAQFQA